MEFIHLHNHTHYSLLDAICTVDGLVNAALENNMNAVALTDHGVMFGAMEFYQKCKSKNIKPIIGFEAYVAQGSSRFDRTKRTIRSDEIIDTESSDGLSVSNINYAHLILLAKNETGYKNLIKLNSIGHTEGHYYKPRIDLEVLNKYREGIIALSACAGGVVSCYIVRNNLQEARKMAGAYKDIFGEDFYLELQNHLTLDSEKKVLREMPKIAKELGLKLIATNDVHYIKKEHAIAHNIYLHISSKQNKNTDFSRITSDLRYGTEEIYFKSTKEMCELFRDFPEAIKSTLEVTEKCNLEINTQVKHMPKFPIPDSETANSLEKYLSKLSFEGLKRRIPDYTPEAKERLEYEIGIINRMDFAGYFLIVADFIDAARKKGILVGPGRGSAAGSLVCYCLGITNVNPLEYNLLFERFLNPERISMPDIDIDFQDDRRDEVIQYAKEKYGENSVSQIVTFNKLAPRGVLKDVGKVLNFDFKDINTLTAKVPIVFGKVAPLAECMENVPDFKEYFSKADKKSIKEKKKLFDYSQVLENLNKNSSTHASGVVIAPSDITDYVPLSRTKPADKNSDIEVFCTQYDMNRLEDAGLIKMDFLGLKELKIISRTLALVNKNHNLSLTTDNIPLDDKPTYELFSSGNTTGIFQFSKSKMREYLTKLKPKDINDLAAMNALYRPGPMKLIPDFIEKRFGRREITYLHPLMENSLKETYGIIVYQEQVMQIAREIAGFSMAQADNMRKAMGKKIISKMMQLEEDFINGAENNGVNKKTARKIFELIKDFADYGFNKSHGVAYSILAYYTAYLKTHYPLEFLAVSMEGRKDDMNELQILADDCKRMGIKLSAPDVNESLDKFSCLYENDDMNSGKIIYGLSAIKNVGVLAAENIMQERIANGKYDSFMDFLTRVNLRLVNKRAVESLILAGAFDTIHNNRKQLCINIEYAMGKASKLKDEPESNGQELLFSPEVTKSKKNHFDYLASDEYDEKDKYIKEKEALGFYLTGHPLDKYRKQINQFINLNFGEDITEISSSVMQNVKVCGVVNGLQEKVSKRQTRFCVFNLQDFYGSAECVAFSKVYESKKSLFTENGLVFIEGKLDEEAESIKIIVDNILPVESLTSVFGSNLIIYFDERNITEEKIVAMHTLLYDYPGSCNVYFKVKLNDKPKHYLVQDIKVRLTNELISNLKNLIGENNLHIN